MRHRAEPLPQDLSPGRYWEAARHTVRSMLGDNMREAPGSGPYHVDGRPTYRALVEGRVGQLTYVYTEERWAYVVSCSAPKQRFEGLVSTFDAVGQSLVIGPEQGERP